MAYDPDNIFAKMLRREIPCEPIHEDDYALAFNDIQPQAPIHALVIPKGQYVSLDDFAAKASDAEIAGLWRAVASVADKLGAVAGGYRVLANHGRDAHQVVDHFHVHVFAGCDLGAMVKKGLGESA